MAKKVISTKKQVSPKGWDKVETSVNNESLDVSKMTKEQLIALLGDKYTIAPKADDTKLYVTLGEYKGKPTISIIRGTESFVNRPMTLGVTKARLVIEALEDIKAFLKKHA